MENLPLGNTWYLTTAFLWKMWFRGEGRCSAVQIASDLKTRTGITNENDVYMPACIFLENKPVKFE